MNAVRAWLSGERVPGGVLAGAFAAMVALNAALFAIVGAQVDPVPDLLHPATPDSLRAALDALDASERAVYVRFAWLDVLYPLAYGTFLSGALARLRPDRLRALPWLAVATAGFDLVENALFVGLCAGALPVTDATLAAGAAANALKWLGADVSLLVLVGLLAWRALSRRQATSAPPSPGPDPMTLPPIPARFDAVEPGAEAIFDALTYAMDHSAWVERTAADGVTVASAHPVYAPGGAPHPVEGFLITAELAGPTVDHGVHYFHDACHFADTANRMTSRSQILRVLDDRLDHYRAIVRTGFALPFPLQDREFLHWVGTRKHTAADGAEIGVIAYHTVADDGLDAPWPGHLRCPMAPSGQRVTALPDGRVRLQHCMTYTLGGWIPAAVQDALFHRGHVAAYLEEWQAAMRVLAEEGTRPAATTTRAAS